MLVSAILLGCIAHDAYYTQERRDLNEAWEYVCEIDAKDTGFDCSGIPKPRLIYNDGLNSYMGANGVYFIGEDELFVRWNRPSKEARMQTVVHELTHYLMLYKTDPSRVTRTDSCNYEAAAFAVGDRYAKMIGRDDLMRGSTWWFSYAWCQNWGNR